MANESYVPQQFLNITVKQIDEFISSYKEKSPYYLSAKVMAQDFMDKYPTHDFEAEFNSYVKEHSNIESIHLYIVQVYFGFQSSLKSEYEKLKQEAKIREKKYAAKVAEIDRIIESISNEEKYKKDKMKFFRNINNGLLEKARAELKPKRLFYKAVAICRKSTVLSLLPFSNWQYFDYRQYENFDIKRVINFGKASVNEGRRISSLKAENNSLYSKEFCNYLKKYKIVEETRSTLSNTQILQNRLNLYDTAIDLLNAHNYQGFVYLMVPQIEGLFSIYCKLLGISDIENRFSITEKLIEAYEFENFFGFVYYTYDFPIIRNEIAHGNIIKVSEIDAYELLADIYYISTQLIVPLAKK